MKSTEINVSLRVSKILHIEEHQKQRRFYLRFISSELDLTGVQGDAEKLCKRHREAWYRIHVRSH